MGDQQKNTQEPDVNQLRKVRREKLADLQANGKNPFEITKYDVTCHARKTRIRSRTCDAEACYGKSFFL